MSGSPHPNLDIGDLSSYVSRRSEVHVNVEQHFIVTTEDKMRLCLSDHLQVMDRRRDWIAPLGVFISLVVALLTSSFRDWYLPKATWQAIFVLMAVISFAWFLWTLRYLYQYKQHSLDAVIREIKAEAISQQTISSSVEVESAQLTVRESVRVRPK